MRKACLLLLTVCWSPSFFAGADSSDDGRVPYPEGYRKWTFLHATVLGPKNGIFAKRPCEKPCTGGIMYFYANEKAMEGLRTERSTMVRLSPTRCLRHTEVRTATQRRKDQGAASV